MLLYMPSTLLMASNKSSSISSNATALLNTNQTTRPGCECVTREKKFDHASEPA